MGRISTCRCMESQNRFSINTSIALWFIWAAVFLGMLIIQLTVKAGASDSSLGVVALALTDLPFLLIAIATGIRWFAIPRIKRIGWILVVSIVGIWFAESAYYLQVFLIGEPFAKAQLIVFILSFLAVIQFVPIYLHRIQ